MPKMPGQASRCQDRHRIRCQDRHRIMDQRTGTVDQRTGPKDGDQQRCQDKDARTGIASWTKGRALWTKGRDQRTGPKDGDQRTGTAAAGPKDGQRSRMPVLGRGAVRARIFCLAMAGSADRNRALSRIPNCFAMNGLRPCNSLPRRGTAGVALPVLSASACPFCFCSGNGRRCAACPFCSVLSAPFCSLPVLSAPFCFAGERPALRCLSFLLRDGGICRSQPRTFEDPELFRYEWVTAL